MKIQYSSQDIREIYNKIVKKAISYVDSCQHSKAIGCIRCAANLQSDFNDIFCDNRLNQLLKEISTKELEALSYEKNEGKYLFCDFSGNDNKGLSQQYLDAIFSIENVSLVYIHETRMTTSSENIKKMLNDHHAEIVELGEKTDLDKAKEIYKIILKSRPEKAFCHLHPTTSIPFLIALYSFPTLIKYNINLTDHAFWLGGPDIFNYNIEFRSIGAKLSIERRGFRKEQLIIMPFYPWHDKYPFEGFPEECKDKIIVFSGGALYKIEGGGNVFLDLVKEILLLSDKVVFIMAGNGDTSYIDRFVKENNLEGRFVFIGHRRDIYEVLKHIDIFLGTYPIGGGLMTQYAAISGKPILTYKGYSVEKILKPLKEHSIVYETKESLIAEMQKLLRNVDYRRLKGEYFKSLIPSQEEFRLRFKKIVINPTTIDDSFQKEKLPESDKYESYLTRLNDRHKLTLELPILKATHSCLNWKVALNIIMNINKLRICKK